MLRQFELVERVKSYDPDVDEEALDRAYVFAMKMHGSQKRASGDPYFSHPVEVAGILTEYKLDAASIITALLHDTIEDTAASYDDIKIMFGEEVAKLVEGVTKLSKIQLQSDQLKQAENFRKLLLAMSEDIRVLLVKLADRVHNMRTLKYHQKPEKRQRIARETLEIYAPLAERIGMQEMKNELEELSFKELYPEPYESITLRLKMLREEGNTFVEKVIAQLKEDLKDCGFETEITGREKSPYSIWRKMKRQGAPFEALCDIMAFRIIVPTIADCYHTLGIIHTKYSMIPGRYKDYISTPKPNGYKSLHTGVIGPEKHRIEIQIRTKEMHDVAEIGLAAHWRYKQGDYKTDGRQFAWLRELIDIMEQSDTSKEFLEHAKMEMYQDEVFCFSPKGDLITLPKGGTAIDFAYAVHSGLGNRCVGVKINGVIKPLKTELVNGDQIEILTSKTQTPSPEWERFAVTGKAKAAIRRFIREQKREQYLEVGREILQKAFKSEGYDYNDKSLENVTNNFQQKNVEDLIAEVGEGIVPVVDVLDAVFPGRKSNFTTRVVNVFKRSTKKINDNNQGSKKQNQINGLIPGLAYSFAKCCRPLPGDRIVGIVTTGKGVTIHRIDCSNLERFSQEPERWIDVSWNEDYISSESHVSRLRIVLENKPGSLGTLSNVIAKNQGNIANLNIIERTHTFFELSVDIEVKNVNHLSDIMAALRASPDINSVRRSQD
ncbi:MAG: bifunctional (p)ppGpp synthetase/guanosine-3',5'-bis(diphosphate) 3'-pyrophosphohydrolase [Alphaproteobacteria bacterium]|nr:bifunctional (p)ppGpp synthetase/guanosine-3',5'-bis(diphosphate) 3'-pyrophosphohydrolase [Alphaproteobacteria bacterium]